MNISYSSLSQLHGELSIDLDKSDFQPKISEELKKLKKKAQVKGFRAGHVPESLIKSMYGSTVKSETLNKIVTELVDKYQKDHEVQFMGDLLPVSEPLTDEQFNGDSISIKFEVGLAPKLDADELVKKLVVDNYSIEVPESEVDQNFENLTNRLKTNVEISGPLELNDMANLKVRELEGDTLKENGWESDFLITMDHLIQDELKSRLLNQIVGFKLNIDITKVENDADDKIIRKYLLKIPDDNDIVVGNMYEAEVTSILRKENPVLDEAFFNKAFGEGRGITNIDQAKAAIREELNAYYKEQCTQIQYHQILHKLSHESGVELPDDFLKKWLQANFEEWRVENTHELDHKYYHYRESMIWRLLKDMLFVSKGLKVSYDDAKKHMIAKYKSMYPGIQLPDEQWEMLAARGFENKDTMMEYFQISQTEKVLEWISDNVQKTDKVLSIDEYKEIVKKMNSHDDHMHHHEH
ncbi:MAG: hypothetical protein IPL98_18960 [Saprospiraceae bacterium]|nr:hypothetical protein [Saprospiraceae bacterium]